MARSRTRILKRLISLASAVRATSKSADLDSESTFTAEISLFDSDFEDARPFSPPAQDPKLDQKQMRPLASRNLDEDHHKRTTASDGFVGKTETEKFTPHSVRITKSRTKPKPFRHSAENVVDNFSLGLTRSKGATRDEVAEAPQKKMKRVKSWMSFKFPPPSAVLGPGRSAGVTASTHDEQPVRTSTSCSYCMRFKLPLTQDQQFPDTLGYKNGSEDAERSNVRCVIKRLFPVRAKFVSGRTFKGSGSANSAFLFQ